MGVRSDVFAARLGIRHQQVGTHEGFEWEKGSDPPDAYIMVAGKRVAVDITTLKRRGTGQGNAAKPRLRFDKVATRLIERLQATLGETVPDGMTWCLAMGVSGC